MDIKNKNMRGFTLIELLAVIVVLAIVMLIAATAVLPRMSEARQQVFAIEANKAIEAASTYFLNNNLTGGGDTLPVADGAVKCVPIKTLITNGYFDADNSKYDGRVLVKKQGSLYLYVVTLTNQQLMVVDKGLDGSNAYNADIVAKDVLDFDSSTFEPKSTCSSVAFPKTS